MFKKELNELCDNPTEAGQSWSNSRDTEYEMIANDALKEIANIAGHVNLGKAMGRNFLIGELQDIPYIENLKNSLKDVACCGLHSWIFKYDTVFLPIDKIEEVKQMCFDEKLEICEYDSSLSIHWNN